jgi:hypothetical protein
MAPNPAPATTAVPWSIRTISVGKGTIPVARLSFQLYCRTVLPGRHVTSADGWIDTGAPLSVIPFHVHHQRLLWQSLTGITTTWAGQRCDVGRVEIWLPTEEPPFVRGPFSLLAKFPHQDPPGDPVPILLGLGFFLTHQAEFSLLLPPQHSDIRLP